jgi:hypothetical protein
MHFAESFHHEGHEEHEALQGRLPVCFVTIVIFVVKAVTSCLHVKACSYLTLETHARILFLSLEAL